MIEDLLDQLDELIERGTSLPFSNGKVVISAEDALNLIRDIRLAMPNEVKQARALVADRNEILARAKRESDMQLRVAEEKAKELVSRDAIVQEARREASEKLAEANAKARELRLSTNEYIESSLKHCEEVMARAGSEISTSVVEITKLRESIRKAVAGGEKKK